MLSTYGNACPWVLKNRKKGILIIGKAHWPAIRSSSGIFFAQFPLAVLKKTASENVFPLTVFELDLPISFHRQFLIETSVKSMLYRQRRAFVY